METSKPPVLWFLSFHILDMQCEMLYSKSVAWAKLKSGFLENGFSLADCDFPQEADISSSGPFIRNWKEGWC